MTKDMHILIVDDEPAILFGIKHALAKYTVETCNDPLEALRIAAAKTFHMVIVDYRMPGMNGLNFLEEACKENLFKYRILLTAFADKELLKTSLNKKLAHHVLEKPVDMKELRKCVDAGMQFISKETARDEESDFLRASYEAIRDEFFHLPEKIIGISGGLKEVFDKARLVAGLPVSVLLTGETGTGKELIACTLHSMSGARGNFVKINCAAIPESLIESELFGHVKGAFTGASSNKIGRIELANGGTLFLDEIGEMKIELQSKLLRVLQEKQYVPVGGTTEKSVDFRLITATNVDLEQAVQGGRFRQDLYYRINMFPIHMPPLRERREDITDLLHFYVEEYCREENIGMPEVEEAVYHRLEAYAWPGNVRELENAVRRVLIIFEGGRALQTSDFDFLQPRSSKDGPGNAIDQLSLRIKDGELSLQDVEEMLLGGILNLYGGNISQASRETGISRNKFYRNVEGIRK